MGAEDLDILAQRFRTTSFVSHDKNGPDAIRFYASRCKWLVVKARDRYRSSCSMHTNWLLRIFWTSRYPSESGPSARTIRAQFLKDPCDSWVLEIEESIRHLNHPYILQMHPDLPKIACAEKDNRLITYIMRFPYRIS